jgi:hypothetical protein
MIEWPPANSVPKNLLIRLPADTPLRVKLSIAAR